MTYEQGIIDGMRRATDLLQSMPAYNRQDAIRSILAAIPVYDAAPAPQGTAARLAAAGLTTKKLDWEAVEPSDDNDHATFQAWMSWWNGSSNSLKLVSSGEATPEAAQAGFEADVLAALTEDSHE